MASNLGIYLSEDSRVQPRLLKELDGDLAGYDSNAVCVGLSEELAVDALLLRVEVEVRPTCKTTVLEEKAQLTAADAAEGSQDDATHRLRRWILQTLLRSRAQRRARTRRSSALRGEDGSQGRSSKRTQAMRTGMLL